MRGISIIIVTYRPGNELIELIGSIREKVKCPYEIIISDNSPECSALLTQLAIDFPALTILRNPANPGFGSANNAGAAIACHPYLMFINPDAELRSTLDDPGSFFSSDTGIVSGYCVDEAGQYKQTAGLFPIDPKLLMLFSRRLDRRPPLDTGEFTKPDVDVDYAEGSLYLMRADVFHQVNGFDENIFLYGEDYELSYRVYKAGYQNKISRRMEYLHVGGFNHGREPYIVNGLIYFSSKHLNSGRALGVRGILLIRSLMLLSLHLVLSACSSRHRRRLRPLTKSLYRTLRP